MLLDEDVFDLLGNHSPYHDGEGDKCVTLQILKAHFQTSTLHFHNDSWYQACKINNINR